jgi:hypothetical protein
MVMGVCENQESGLEHILGVLGVVHQPPTLSRGQRPL